MHKKIVTVAIALAIMLSASSAFACENKQSRHENKKHHRHCNHHAGRNHHCNHNDGTNPTPDPTPDPGDGGVTPDA